MSKFKSELSPLVQKIVAGKCPKSQVRQELTTIVGDDDPDDIFVPFQPERKDKPWDLAYLKELENLFYCGAVSREFIEYMAEVSDEVYRIKRLKRLAAGLLLAAAAAVLIFTVIRILWRD